MQPIQDREFFQALTSIIESTAKEQDCLTAVEVKFKELSSLTPSSSTLAVRRFHFFSLNAESPITAAAKKTYWQVVKIMMQHAEPGPEHDSRLFGFIHYACFLGMLDKVEEAVRAGISINAKGSKGSTPLHQAATAGHDAVVQFLVGHEDCEFEPLWDGDTPLVCAAKNEHWSTARILVEKMSLSHQLDTRGYALIHYACYLGLKDKVADLLSNGVSVNARSRHGCTPLIQAINGSREDVVELLVNTPDCDLEAKHDGFIPLAFAGKNKKWKIARQILQKMRLSNEMDSRGFAQIHYACYLGMFDKLRELLSIYPDHELPSEKSSTPLQQAELGLKDKPVEGEHQQVIDHLKSLKDAESPNEITYLNLENTPLMRAGLRRRKPFKVQDTHEHINSH